MVWSAVAVHLVGLMTWKGLEEGTAGLLIGAYPIFGVPAVLVMGWLSSRWSKQRIAAIGGLIGVLGMLLLVFWTKMEIWQMLVLFILLAPNEGTWPLGWALLADQFGVKNYGLLRGGIVGIISFMSVGAPFYSGWVFDNTQSYLWVVLPAAILLGAAGLLNWFMPPASTMPRRKAATV